MTNTESRIAVELEELAPWDADALEKDEDLLTEADRRELAVYGFDSDQRTLVGLGPVERARRSRRAAEIPDGERMPQSQPPGPFIAADDDVAAELLAVLRRPALARWTFALPAALAVGILAVVLVRGLAHQAPAASKPAAAAVARPVAAVAPAQVEDTGVNERRESEIVLERAEEEIVPERPRAEPRVAPVSAPVAMASMPVVAAPALPVKLAELPAPTITDLAGSAAPSAGTLNVTSNPPANVLLDGRPLGKAPRIVQVPPGTHTVLFIHPLYGRQSLKVNVGAGRATSASANF